MSTYSGVVSSVAAVLLIVVMAFAGATYTGYDRWKSCEEPFPCQETVYVGGNETEYVNNTEVVYETVHEHHHHEDGDASESESEPPSCRGGERFSFYSGTTLICMYDEEPKYRLGWDYNAEVFLSSTPVTPTQWTGNGVPYAVIQYTDGQSGTTAPMNDTGMHHNAFVNLWGYTGTNLCDNRFVRFWNFTATPRVEENAPLTYSSVPVPNNLLNLMGSGENCYARVTATSTWLVYACMEGDGSLTSPWDEHDEDADVIHRHVDFMDECFSKLVTVP